MDSDFCYPDFSILPAHIITHILGYLKFPDLNHSSTVCKSWRYASTDPKIMRRITLQPLEEDFPEITSLNHNYGGLNLSCLHFKNSNSYYFQFFEKFCPFINKLQIFNSNLSLNHLLKLLELSTCLEAISFNQCAQFAQFTELFPSDYECQAKNQIVKNLTGITRFEFVNIRNFRLIADFVRHAPNLDTFEYSNPAYGETFMDFFTIFNNYDASKLKNLYWSFGFSGCSDVFVAKFVQIQNLYLKSFDLYLPRLWDGGYNSFLFIQFILKLQSLIEFSIQDLKFDQLSIICQYMVNLKSFDCPMVGNDQPISELSNLKQLQKLRCGCLRSQYSGYRLGDIAEIDKFFKCKFVNLNKFYFEEFVTESNLLQFCENHPNLIELELTGLLTRNLEIIFKHLTKLRILNIDFGFKWATESLKYSSLFESDHQYVYKLSRLQDLEVFHLSELVPGIDENDVRQLKKLRSTNLPQLFCKTTDIDALMDILMKDS